MYQLSLTQAHKIDFHNYLIDGITHLHSFGLSHGDLSLLNIQMTHSSDTIKLLDFRRSASNNRLDICLTNRRACGSFPESSTKWSGTAPPKKAEHIHPATRPFAAPEVLRGECQDPLLADAYSFGMILVAIDRVEGGGPQSTGATEGCST